jgi:hypothetical protein|nr:metal-dependent hydrolase [Halorutilus salinus]
MRYGVGAYLLAVVVAGAALGYLVYTGRADLRHVAVGVAGGVGGFPFAVAGAGFPDIDHHSAKPHRFFRRWVSVIAGGVAVYFLFASGVATEAGIAVLDGVTTASVVPEGVVGVGVSAVGGIVAGVSAYMGVGLLKPPHRGVTHTFGTGVVVAVGVGVAVGYGGGVVGSVVVPSSSTLVGVLAGCVAGVSFFVGFLSHLQCDGLLVGFLPDAM